MHSVLVVDDERDIRESLRGVLEDEEYKVLLAESGEACLEQLKKRSCEVVLLDIWLPGMDGLEALSRIQAGAHPPSVIMISGHGTIETAVRATKLGAFDFIEKPLSLEKIVLRVRNAVQQAVSHAAEQAAQQAAQQAAALTLKQSVEAVVERALRDHGHRRNCAARGRSAGSRGHGSHHRGSCR